LEQAHIHTREQVLAIPNRQAWDISHATEEWFVREAEYLGLDIELARRWATQYAEEKQRRLLASKPAIDNLSRDYKLVLISNNIGNLEQVLTEVGLRTSF
jgi:lysyl-tRNA synthetase class I